MRKKLNKLTGLGEIPSELIKQGSTELIRMIQTMFQSVINGEERKIGQMRT